MCALLVQSSHLSAYNGDYSANGLRETRCLRLRKEGAVSVDVPLLGRNFLEGSVKSLVGANRIQFALSGASSQPQAAPYGRRLI